MSEQNIPKGFWLDASGSLVPEAKIKDIDKARNKVVLTMVDQAKQMSETLRQFKLAALTTIDGFVELSAAEYQIKLGGKKGNVSLTSFDGTSKVVLAMQETIVFDERLQVAKALIDQCIHAWAKGANKNIQALVNGAFQVDKEGKVSTGRVLNLRTLKIDDEQWRKAMEAIADSMKAVASKSYVRFYERNAAGAFVAIPLDVSAI